MSDREVSSGLGRRLVRNTLHAATGRVAAVLLWALLTPPILRALGPEGFAVWTLFYALTGYFAALDFGIVQGTLRHVAGARERGAHDEAGAFTTLGIAGFLLFGIVWFALALLLRDTLIGWLHLPATRVSVAGFAMITGAVVFALAGCANVFMATLQGYDRFDLANLVSLVVTVQQAIGIVVVLRSGWGLTGLVINVGLGWAVGTLVGIVVLRRGVPEFRWAGLGASRRHVRGALAFGGPLQVASLMAVLHMNLDKFLLPGLVALAAVTPYELGSRVPGTMQTFPIMLLLAMLPAAASMHAAGDSARLRELYVRGNRYLLTATAVMLAALIGPADRLFATWLGPGHGDAAMALRGLTLATGFSLATGMGSVSVRARGRTDLEAWFGALSLGLHLSLSLLLMPRWGLRGAVVAIVVANAIACPTFLQMVASTFKWRSRDVLVTPHLLPAVAVAAGVAASFGLDRALPAERGLQAWALLTLVAGTGAVVALVVLVATGYFQWREARGLLGSRRLVAE